MVEPYKPLYTVKQVSQILLTNVYAVYDLMNKGYLPYLELGQRKVRGSDLEKFIEKYPIAQPGMENKERKGTIRSEGVIQMEEKRIWYLCDGEKPDCKKNHCYKNTDDDPCRHTTDIEHALNFTKKGYASHTSYREAGKGEVKTVGAMKRLYEDIQENTYRKLENLGLSREEIYEFEAILTGEWLNMDFGEFAGKMADYAIEIGFLSETTGYTPERLWGIWGDAVKELAEDTSTSMDEEWRTFRNITRERDW